MSYHLCPVCGFSKLPRPPKDYLICPCCGTEFEADDFETSHSALRQKWMADGMKWYSRRTPEPYDYNPSLQVRNLLGFNEKPITESSIGIVELDYSEHTIRPSNFGDIRTFGRWFVIGNSGAGTGQATA